MAKQKESFFSGINTLLGWYGMGAVLIAYALISLNVLQSNNLTYQLLNLTGAVGLVIAALTKKDYPPAILNIIWSIVAIVALVGLVWR